ncbi:hypothetical protein AVEN_242847-1 [Araneus ventricosus]|uniref:Uncharacterized protein n=1 Tax=Araneus ventricosus TaxID=182803 RepID=A0A4Y2CKC2_ARAVE|nr:hypothetical protein AVEN_242847-1 [Araneus ventricosus]
MTRTTPELTPPLQTYMPHQRESVWLLRMIWSAAGPIHGGSSVESGFEPGTFQPQSRDLTTRPPRPLKYSNERFGIFCRFNLATLVRGQTERGDREEEGPDSQYGSYLC